MYLGLVGRNCAGKGTLASFLGEEGFTYFSLSDEIREELKRKGLRETRDNLIKVGNEMRLQLGPGVLARRVVERIRSSGAEHVVVDSIRNPHEVYELRKRLPGFVLVAVEATDYKRYKRCVRRARGEKYLTFSEFLKKDSLEDSEDERFQMIGAVLSDADVSVSNDSTVEELRKRAHELLRAIREGKVVGRRILRKSKYEYYLDIAREVASRGTCVRKRFGAVIVVNDHIISTGYTGAPRGAINCSDVGYCTRDRLRVPSGERYELSRSVHAEQNAIINAARAGVSTIGGVLFLYGEDAKTGEIVNAVPCKMCRRAIINAGITKVVARTPDDGYRIDYVREYVELSNREVTASLEELRGY